MDKNLMFSKITKSLNSYKSILLVSIVLCILPMALLPFCTTMAIIAVVVGVYQFSDNLNKKTENT